MGLFKEVVNLFLQYHNMLLLILVDIPDQCMPKRALPFTQLVVDNLSGFSGLTSSSESSRNRLLWEGCIPSILSIVDGPPGDEPLRGDTHKSHRSPPGGYPTNDGPWYQWPVQ